MLRFGSFLMMLLLTVPIVRECCLPVAHTPPCHQSKQADEVTCYSEQAVTETKTFFSGDARMESHVRNADAMPAILPNVCGQTNRIVLTSLPAIHIYLRTSALLI